MPAATHQCPECTWVGKTKGALTQHVNKEHGPLTKLRAQFGNIAPRPGGALNPDRPLRAAPSGIPSVDYAIGIGGVPRGTLIEVFGPPKAGKTFTALTFSAYAQQGGGKVGFVDAERALQPTFLDLIPGLDPQTMEYAPGSVTDPDSSKQKLEMTGEEALEMSRQFIATGLFDIWTIDSVHALTPQSMLDRAIGDSQASAALALLMSQGCQVLDHVIANTNTVCIFINHKKAIPQVKFGRDWYTPGGSALDYYCAIRLNVWEREPYYEKSGRKIGHKVRVKVEKSKVAAPHATADYDLFYASGTVKDDGRVVVPGVDVASSWLSVLVEEGKLAKNTAHQYFDTESGEKIGSEAEVRERMYDPSDELRRWAGGVVYPEAYRHVTT